MPRFDELVPAGADPLAVEAVVRRLADTRLITTAGDPNVAVQVSVEVAHEALIRGWGRLHGWIEADRAGLLIQRQLADAAREWEANHREGSFLYRGTRLAVAWEWAQTDRESLNEVEARFLAASRNRRRIKTIAMVASILVVMASVLGGWEVSRLSLSRKVDRDTEQAKRLSDETRWPEAIKVLEGTQESLGRGILNEPLRIRVSSAMASYTKKQKERKAPRENRGSWSTTGVSSRNSMRPDSKGLRLR